MSSTSSSWAQSASFLRGRAKAEGCGAQGEGRSPARVKPRELCMLELRGHLGRPTHCTDEVTEPLTVQTQTQLGLIPKPTYVLWVKVSYTAGAQSQACLWHPCPEAGSRQSQPVRLPWCWQREDPGSQWKPSLGAETAGLKPKPDWPESRGTGTD